MSVATDSTCAHSADFRSVIWHGQPYSFTPTQAAIVKQLWAAHQNGTPELGGQTLLEGADSQSGDLSQLFHRHRAWGSMIVPGGTRGSYRHSA